MAKINGNPEDRLALLQAKAREKADLAMKKMDALFERVQADPGHLTNSLLDNITSIAAASPYRDINDPGAELHHRQNPAQDISLHAVRLLECLAQVAPAQGAAIVWRLEYLANDTLDYDIRREATMSIWCLSMDKDPLKTYAVEALRGIAAENDNSYIRTLARDRLLQTAQQHPDITAQAIAAQVSGAEDPDAESRRRALGQLISRVKSPTCSDDEAARLLTVFEKAAARPEEKDKGTLHWANQGISDVRERQKSGGANLQHKFP